MEEHAFKFKNKKIPFGISNLGNRRKYVLIQEDKMTERQRDRETERQRDRETERQRDRETERQRDRQTERQKDREAERQRDRVSIVLLVSLVSFL